MPVLIPSYRRFPLSDLSYLLLTAFLLLHAVGAHATYEKVPLGDWVGAALGLGRNHFDRLVHFSFGLLLAYPLHELLVRGPGLAAPWAYDFPVTTVLSWSGLFEIFESWAARLVSPELGNA